MNRERNLLPCQLEDPARGRFTPSGNVTWLGRPSRRLTKDERIERNVAQAARNAQKDRGGS